MVLVSAFLGLGYKVAYEIYMKIIKGIIKPSHAKLLCTSPIDSRTLSIMSENSIKLDSSFKLEYQTMGSFSLTITYKNIMIINNPCQS